VRASRAIPKSRIFTRPSAVRKRFSGVRRLEPAAHLDRRLDRLPQREGPAVEPLPEALPLEELEHDVGAALVGADVEDRGDGGVGQGGDRPGLALELPEPLLVGGGLGEYDLHRDVAPQAGVVGAVDLRHPAGTQPLDDLVGPETRSRSHCHGPLR
jgi:hypothetical protein